MRRKLGTNWSSEDSHPPEDDLLFYVDGELPAKKTARIRAHLEACWNCRAKTERIEETITSFVHFLDSSVAPNIGEPPYGWKRLEGMMAQAAAEAGRRPHRFPRAGALRRLFGRPLVRTLAFGAAAAGALFMVAVRFEGIPQVSANQLIERVADAREDRIRAVAEPVVYQRLAVRRTAARPADAGTATWEIWNDLNRKRFKQHVEEPGTVQAREGTPDRESVVTELTEIFEANRMDPRAPLTADGYQAWRGRMRPSSEEVEETNLADGSRAFTLTAAAAESTALNAIVEVRMVVRNADWHPVEQQLKVRGEHGLTSFSLTETAYAVEPIGGLPPNLFARPASPFVPLAPKPVKLPEPPVFPAIEAVIRPGAAEAATSEIEALFALHRTGACLGGMVSVERSAAGTVEVRGVVNSDERRQELLAALRGIPWVTVDVRIADEVPDAEPPPAPDRAEAAGAAGTATVAADAPRAKMALQDLLKEYFGAHRDGETVGERIASFSHRAVSASEAALEEAWELQRLVDRGATLNADEPRPSARYALGGMIRDHMNALRTQLAAYREVVDPVLSFLLESEPGAPAALEVRPAEAGSPGPADTVERIVRISLGLFADGGVPIADRGAALRELQARLSRWEADLRDVEKRTARSFSNDTDAFIGKRPE